MRDLYLKLIETLTENPALFTNLDLLPPAVIDLYNGQPDNPNGFEFVCPALFVDYKIDWERGGSGLKKGVVNLDIHVLLQPGGGAENFNPRLSEALKKIGYYELIATLAENVTTDNVGNLTLISEEPMQTDYFCYHVLRFNAPVYRHKASAYIHLINTQPDITVTK